MKKVLLLVAVMAMVASASMAQVKFGGGLTLGTKMGLNDSYEEVAGVGLNVRATFDISEKFKIAPGFTYFFPGSPDGMDMSAWQLNADAQYHFYSNESISIYGIGGLNYSHAKVEFDAGDLLDDLFGEDISSFIPMGAATAEESDNKIGVDLGAGINFGKFYGEIKYDTAFEQMAFSVGILFGGK
ncbi:outer membrane beta-barrel protein [Carboxylicivirga sp. M1479]|uniref:outer membrane beta-barrel protein n=1 Tax=Carboxylicivirga sp. M1479 TaxID=2594476 RepID=UPI0011789DDB|nr:outer membrane beta-barrel protein [Carboxylicivirga sp. M1479]TRX62362.1 porin family protein [Carboxylicivirga sp. M1479]